ncbi:MAG: hypothetical protein ABJF23_18730 [Bryobacteraceae bacterium]
MITSQDPNSIENSTAAQAQRDFSVEEIVAIGQANESFTQDDPGVATEIAGAAGLPVPISLPIPFPLPKRNVSGRYESGVAFFQLELRVDVDGNRPMKRVSGDFYQISGATKTYFGSLQVNSPTISVSATQVVIQGLGNYTYTTSYPILRVTIPRVSIFTPAAPATVQFFNLAMSPGATYVCKFISAYLRTVVLETDRVSDVGTPVFSSYNTASLPSGGPARTLSVVSAYAEAGIEVQVSPASDVVNVAEAGANHTWSDAELHASMVHHFSLWVDQPQWKVWEVVAQTHDLGPGLLGIMFDQSGKQRQGCAVFHAGLGGTTAEKLREQLYTYVHELGHCFNLLHSWQKSLAVPPGVNRPNALSWMNYPWNYPPGGEPAFWAAFAFQFDDQEIIHLRHAYRNAIIMGGNPFTVGSGLERVKQFADPITDASGLNFTISMPRGIALGEPAVVELKLESTSSKRISAHPYLHPKQGLVSIAIKKPNGDVVVYEPMIEQCMGPRIVSLAIGDPPIEDSAYIGYGKDGLYFDQTGPYQIRASYSAIDGSLVVSNVITSRVRTPRTEKDEKVADLLMGNEQGALLFLLGSDSPELQSGNRALETLISDYADHPLTVYAQMAVGMNRGRAFTTVGEGPKANVRKADPQAKADMLGAVVAKADAKAGMDPTTREMVVGQLARAQRALGNDQGAAETERKLRKTAARAAGGGR